MKNQHLYTLGFAFIAAMSFTACNGLGKMAKKASLVQYSVTPNPLEEHGDSVAVSIKVTYPPKYFGKKVVLSVTPTIGGKSFRTATVLGEKAQGTGTKIMYKTGGSFTYSDKIAYSDDMKNTDFKVKATGAVKSKTKEMPEAKIGDGTIITPYLLKNSDKPIVGKDQFQKVTGVVSESQIMYQISSSVVRPTELTSQSVKDMKTWVKTMQAWPYGADWKGCDVSAYASPDGEMSMNANLAVDRAKSASKAYMGIFKDKNTKLDAGTQDAFYHTSTTAEDWDGFRKLVEASNLADKRIIIDVLNRVSDPEQREKEIKNFSKTYLELANDILPKLRRSVMKISVDKHSRPDDLILKMAKTTPDSLSVEEILYAATLTNDWNEKLSIYKSAERVYPKDWRTANNVGYVYLMQNKIEDAKSAFDRAAAAGASPVIDNNKAIVMRWKGDRKGAYELLKKSTAAGPEVSYNMGIIDVQNGHYADAVSHFGGTKDFNAALAKLLNGQPDDAMSTIDGAAPGEKDDAMSYYLRAVISARKGNAEGVISNLRTAIQKDGSLKQHAAEDMEFLKWRTNADFKSVVM